MADTVLVMVPQARHAAVAGRSRARRLFLFAVMVIATAPVGAAPPNEPRVVVVEADGVYRVTAEFTVASPPKAVAAVLTDFERIPEFMPDVKRSRILSRTEAGLVVEQEATAQFMMFSKRLHLLLDITEDGGTIRFRDRCQRSFSRYAGAWRLSAVGAATAVMYELAAKPNFDVPGFVLKRLLKRDAAGMIDRLQAEIAARSSSQ